MIQRTRQITTVGMLCAMAYALVALVRVPLVLFLEYEPKDVVIAIGGLVYGPFTSFLAAAIVALLEMVTISEDGILGCIMNVLSSCSFACTAAYIYGRRRTPGGAVLGLLCGWALMAAVMLLWNYLIAPLYMGQPREAVAALLLPAFLPFNLVKGGLNAALVLLLYKPVVTALRRARLAEPTQAGAGGRARGGIALLALAALATFLLLALALRGVIG